MTCDSDWDADFRQPALEAWHSLKKFFERYKLHIHITEELDTSGRRPYPENDKLGMRIEITYRNIFCVLIDYLAKDEYAEYYTLGHWIGSDKWLEKNTPDGSKIPLKVQKVLKNLSKCLNEEDQIEISRHTIYVHGVPMINLPRGIDFRSFETDEPLARLFK